LRSLQAMGHSSARVARAIGCHQQSIQRVVNGDARTISIRLHQGIVAVLNAWWDKSPPERTPSERAAASAARRRAERGNWCQAAALADELLDTPGYHPFAGYRRAHGVGIAPEIQHSLAANLGNRRRRPASQATQNPGRCQSAPSAMQGGKPEMTGQPLQREQ